MKTFDRLTWSVLVFALLLIGCDIEGNAPGGGWTQYEEAEALGRAYCTLLVTCNPPGLTTIESCTKMYVDGVCSAEGFDCRAPADAFGECEEALSLPVHTCAPAALPLSCVGLIH